MAFYSKVSETKSRDQKRRSAEQRGGFDDEGTKYTGARKERSGAPVRKSSSKPTGEGTRSYTRKPADGGAPAKRTYNKSASGEGRSYSRNAADGGAPAKRSYSRPDGGEGRSYSRNAADGGAPAKRSFGRPEGGEGRSYSRNAADGRVPAKRSYNKPSSGEGRSYSRNSADGGAPAKRSYNKPSSGEGRSYSRNAADGGAPAKRSFGRPSSSSEPRFMTNSGQQARTRGDHITPKPYAVQRREQKTNDGMPPFRPQPVLEDEVNENLLSGRNPIREALKSGRDIEKLLVAKGELSGSAKEIVAMAREQRVPIQEVDRVRLDAITPNHQGMLAFASAYKYHSVGEMLALAKSKNEQPFLVMLDGVTDPHNLGAVIRTAECAGAHGVIVQERRAVGLTPAAVKASAGAIEHIMVARVINLVTTLEMLKKQGVWAYAADMSGEDYLSVDYSGGAVIVIGAEGEGVSRLVLENCDKTVALPIRGQIGSLNASVAAGILLYAVLPSR